MPTNEEHDRQAEAYRRVIEKIAAIRREIDVQVLGDPAAVDPARLEQAEHEVFELERERRRLVSRMRLRADRQREWVAEGEPAESGGETRRDQVARALELLGAPARTADLASAVVAVGGEPLSPLKLVLVRREEERQYLRTRKGILNRDGRELQSSGRTALPRAWYITPAISAETLAPAPGTFTLSSWPMLDRLITPVSPRLWTSRAAANVARAMATAGPETADSLRPLLGRLARGAAWGRMVRHGGAELGEVADAAEKDARRLAREHADMAGDAVERITVLGDPEQPIHLFGRKRLIVAEAKRTAT